MVDVVAGWLLVLFALTLLAWGVIGVLRDQP